MVYKGSSLIGIIDGADVVINYSGGVHRVQFLADDDGALCTVAEFDRQDYGAAVEFAEHTVRRWRGTLVGEA